MKKLNNKGFSLVELIVVIAIMAILAVTLAPRLVQYVDRARQASDKEAVNTIFTAAKLANLEEPMGADMTGNLGEGFYTVADGKWTLSATHAVLDVATEGSQEFYDAMREILGDFELKATNVGANTTIEVASGADGKLTVTLDYDGTGYLEADGDYQVSE